MFSSYTPCVGSLCILVLMHCTDSYFLSLFPHFLSPHFLLCRSLTSDQRVQRWTEKAFIVAAPFTDCSTWSGEDNGPVLVQPRARVWGDGVQCGQLLVWTVERESPLHLSLALSLSGSRLSNRTAGVGGGYVQLRDTGLCFLCHTPWLADRGPLWHDPKDLVGDNKASW